ncbi:MAG: ABC transporter substrate-binding protein [Limnochordaceae bacterium]|nr:ABC transporter substrate-binding protein [Limnochordaceae bacterium]
MRTLGTRAWIVAALLVVALAPVPATAAGARTTITFWHAMGGPLGETIKALVDEFNRAHPGVEVVAQYQGNYGQLQQKILASVAAGQPPVVAQSYSNWTEQLLEAKAIVPLDPFVEGPDGWSKEELADFWPVFLEANRWDGTLWSIPFNKSIYVLFYNASLYKELGVSAPTDWEALLKVSKAATLERGGEIVRHGFGLRPNVDQFALFLLTNGGEWLSPDFQKARFAGKPGVEALQFMVDLLHKYRVAYYIEGYMEQDFAAGKVAAYATSVPGRPYVEQAVGDKFEWGIGPLPTRSSRRTPVAGTDLVIFSKATPEQQKAAWTFVKWLVEPQQTARWSMETFYLPVRQSAMKVPAFQEYLRRDPRNGAALVLLPYAVTDPPIQEWNRIRNYISDAVAQAFLLKATPQAALEEAARKTDAELARRR